MSRPKGSKNKIQTGITYPRNCEHCDYVSNNPSMFHYHKKTHELVPKDTYCHFGCGSYALFCNTGGKYTCKEKWAECPAYLDQLSIRTKQSWEGDDQRKEKTKEKFFEHCCGNPDVIEKSKKSIREKWGNFTPEQMKDFRHYARRIRARAQKWAKDQGYELGRQTFHVDHMFSVWDSWLAGLPESTVNHPANLRILEASANSSKGAKSLYTLEELLILTS